MNEVATGARRAGRAAGRAGAERIRLSQIIGTEASMTAVAVRRSSGASITPIGDSTSRSNAFSTATT